MAEPTKFFSDSGSDQVELLRGMVRVRSFEDVVYKSLLDGLVPGTTHLCQGQEATSVGCVSALRDDDYLSYTYRGHGVCIARGMDPRAAFAELFGRTTGVSGGLGGSMHLTDHKIGLMGSFGIVGAGMPFAVGNGLAAKMHDKGQVSMTFCGDGATNIGAFHESMNIASVWSLPVIFVCENNLYGEYSRIDRTTPFEDLARRADAYDMPGVIVDGNDVLAIAGVANHAVARARNGEGPTMIECKTYRRGGHSRTDPAKYRPEKEVAEWFARDPIILFTGLLEQRKILAKEAAEELKAAIEKEMEDASALAAGDPWPEYDEPALIDATYAPDRQLPAAGA